MVGWESLYEVSDLGRVRSLTRQVRCKGGTRTVQGRLLRANGPKYPCVGLWDAATSRSLRVCVHVLVLEAFRGPAPPGMEARHKNGRLTDNRLTNLDWSTHADNIADKLVHLTIVRGERHHKAVLTPADVRAIRASSENATVIGDRYGMNPSAIRNIRRRRTWKHVE